MDQTMQRIASRLAGRGRRAPDLRRAWESLRERLAGTAQKRRVLARRAAIAGPALLVLVAIAAYFALRPIPQPDYATARLDRVFNFTLLTDEFNRLPVEQRLGLIGQLVDRLKGMDAGESALLAAFAAGIAGKAREQLQENASRLAVDLWDKYASEYAAIAHEDREAFLDASYIEFTKLMESLAGSPRELSDSDRLREGRDQARRDQEALRSGRGPSGRAMGRMFTLLHDGVGSHASPSQRSRGQLMMRDMVRRMRGESLGPG